MTHHVSVLLKESIDYLSVKSDGRYADVTFGAGGHSLMIAKQLTTGHVYGFDQDEDSVNGFEGHPNITVIRSNFRFLRNFLRYYDALPVDGILADLGISSHHIETPERGFSFRFDAPLDMRMNTASEFNAQQIIAEYSTEEITRVLRNYGEVDQAWKIANAIVKARTEKQVETTFQLVDILSRFARPGRENSLFAQVFQALRIEVNHEMEALSEFLKQSYDCLKPGGRLVVISYHSLEDRMVKSFLKSQKTNDSFAENIMGRKDLMWKDISRGALTPSEEELNENPRSRSAKLRVAEKI
ncbi:MAG TPA: 16S rRNA (cytosine(1402)-N(4))-methyltransferase [Bacteroidales bacterium]|nr:16S rRNA (cytosine(1402)-N(4))-methyltransferase [Bacteroidales bacterium]HCB63360.1 16S rRNA (cytosine(1402)-N(4))-methyltransferase [Bacteroidales bacterium]HCY23063.1 16S rRNA (cytosine(1402)-N(4))-methyltransferase [Bacteroidales bacterium]